MSEDDEQRSSGLGAAPRRDPSAAETGRPEGARILVVDDDPWILRMLTVSLEKRRFVVDVAHDGRQALERVQAHIPDLILTDLMMPAIDGWGLAERLREDPRYASIPVIFLTALGKQTKRLEALGLSDEDYLPKPFHLEELERKIDAALSKTGG